jgi:hypothetical protein
VVGVYVCREIQKDLEIPRRAAHIKTRIGIAMVTRGEHSSSATPRDFAGVLYTNALSGGTWPERALVFSSPGGANGLVARDRGARKVLRQTEGDDGVVETGKVRHSGGLEPNL